MLELYGRLVGKMERVHLLRRMFTQQLTNNTTLHFGQVPVLLYIREHDRCTQVDLAEALHVTPASIATSTKRLQKAGYLTKTVNENNLRCKQLSITEEGKRALELHKEPFDAFDRAAFSGFSNEELDTLAAYLDRIARNMAQQIGEELPADNIFAMQALLNRIMEQAK